MSKQRNTKAAEKHTKMYKVSFESNNITAIETEVYLNHKTIYRMNKHESKRKILKSEELDEDSDEDMKEDDGDEDSEEQPTHRKAKDSDDMSDDELQNRMLEENKNKTKKTIDLERMTNR
jgi:hypothetical protein